MSAATLYYDGSGSLSWSSSLPITLLASGSAGQALLYGTTNAWTTISGDGYLSTSTVGKLFVTGLDGYALPTLAVGNLNWNGSSWAFTALPTSLPPSGTAGGDLSGSYPNPTVAKIQNVAVPSPTGTIRYYNIAEALYHGCRHQAASLLVETYQD